MGVIKVTPDTASLISVCDMLDDMKVSVMNRAVPLHQESSAAASFRVSEKISRDA